MTETKPAGSGRKLFFGLFIFPLLIAVGMAVLLCTVVILTHEKETPESLIAGIKTSSPGKRWQKAYEFSNELNRGKDRQSPGVMREAIAILKDSSRYDGKTRGYMAIALSHFPDKEAGEALMEALNDSYPDVRLYGLWALGMRKDRAAAGHIAPFLKSESWEERQLGAYAMGVLGDKSAAANLEPLLADPVADVRWNAALSLARLGSAAGEGMLAQMLDRGTLETEFRLLEDQIEKIMTNALKGLALIRKPESIKILQSIAKDDKNLKVRQAAMDAITYIGTKQ
ncbi:MAG: HEAT repeat domain-containing protein [Candidatus Omnitrophica bacterium]|nr:HEAT repeat domain-containing protein [Candidatus Omnitrophota bacterium]